ncbi:DUF3368 domain-containing protein [Tunicatimonas pelagia]|uniref:DUF3368 domain-containing protein n=1 Tax=Tunicatimonas pelagia TaxID=931531 RepID=UPI00266686E1|nr:DUF3368 domain-containing protein [Tunicatimonas pelagia]WKN41720.1 DUF3368 domain-containing protein [Tunicatimonas pelagia]
MNADLIILDETLGRFHAKHANLKVTGTIGVLMKAKTKGFINELKPLLEELRHKGVWIGTKLQEQILRSVGEN